MGGVRSDPRVRRYGTAVDGHGRRIVDPKEFDAACEGLAQYFRERTDPGRVLIVTSALVRQQLDLDAVARAFEIDPGKLREIVATDEKERRRLAALEAEQSSLERIQYLRSLPYKEYLQTDHWKHLRSQKLRDAGGRCQLCSAERVALEVHHNTYRKDRKSVV